VNKQEYILTRKANSDIRTTADIGVEYDALMLEIDPPLASPPVEPQHVAGISDQVNAWLKTLDSVTFESLRKQSYKSQYEAWVVATAV